VKTGFEIGNVRVQVLGPFLVRIEQKGPVGFEDRETFTICDRRAESTSSEKMEEQNATVVVAPVGRIVVPKSCPGLEGIRVESPQGQLLCELSRAMLSHADLPAPSALPAVWTLADAPRLVPPAWGALPPPEGDEHPRSGWDVENSAPDVYVFFPAASGYARFRADFLRLTGAIPRVPLYALGLWYSRYHPYGEEEAMAVIERFRAAGIPLDVFVVDTDWRVGASCGYAIDEALFPHMARFVGRAHERGVRIMLNDHPEPQGAHALDPAELRFRRDGLTSLLASGVDLWWFDRNWHTHLQPPAPGLRKEVWGMRLYHDISRGFAPERRPLILSNVDGIDNGWRSGASHPVSHRYPIWWTGDTRAGWRWLRMGVVNGVESGVRGLLPYVHEDLGGHHGQPEEDLYVRFMQFGACSPVARIHCSKGVHRYPWEYGARAEQIVGEAFRWRYRLLPTLYAASIEANRSGTPLLRRADLEWPDHPEAADNTQFLLGDDLLVAPILDAASEDGMATRTVWIPPGDWQAANSGRRFRGPARIGVACSLAEYPVFIRGGGLVWSIPQRETTGEARWPELAVDAFVPLRDGEQVRTLYEDDGWSMAYERGETAATEFRLERNGSRVELRITPLPAPAGIRPAQRRITVRLHLPPDVSVGSVWLNDRELSADGFAQASASTTRHSAFFQADPGPAGSAMGDVLEWTGTIDPAQPLCLSKK